MMRRVSIRISGLLAAAAILQACATGGPTERQVECVGAGLVGAAVGGLAGNQLGGGTGNTILTAGGAAAGSVVASNAAGC